MSGESMALIAKIRTAAIRLSGNESGATAIEYALLAAMISIAIVNAVSAVGAANGGGWANVANKASAAMSGQ
jgi:Flp pilus assembly pilin Flp